MTTQTIPLHQILIPWATELQVRSGLPQRTRLQAHRRYLLDHASVPIMAYSSMPSARRQQQTHEFWGAVRRFHFRKAARAKLAKKNT